MTLSSIDEYDNLNNYHSSHSSCYVCCPGSGRFSKGSDPEKRDSLKAMEPVQKSQGRHRNQYTWRATTKHSYELLE